MGEKSKYVVGSFLGFTAFIFCAIAWAEPLRCDEGLVELGASPYEVREACGEPAYTDVNRVTRIREQRGDEVLQEFVDVEDWLYDFGPDRLVVALSFEKGTLTSMRAFGYGRAAGETPDLRRSVEVGAPSVLVLFLYGAPSYKDERIETSVITKKKVGSFPRQLSVQVWTYNLGPDRFMRILHFVDGRLQKIEQGPRGF